MKPRCRNGNNKLMISYLINYVVTTIVLHLTDKDTYQCGIVIYSFSLDDGHNLEGKAWGRH